MTLFIIALAACGFIAINDARPKDLDVEFSSEVNYEIEEPARTTSDFEEWKLSN